MAAPRKSAQQLAAREKARAKAREMTERHERLIEMASEFFEQQEQAEQVRAEAQQKADAILAKAEEDATAAVLGSARTVKAMLDSGAAKSDVAARLGLSGTEVKRLAGMVAAAPEITENAGDESPEGAEESAAEAT
ncbi:hypothetical protein [Paenarthrobacter ureafaciens]|uniref:hypothetical protein n=1 Tax=Paenarthrobacter ureafaciens TaxID=37931 RepID=UPI0009ACB952|nr:hypothetical protein [Paenarthrobacter ureafaciens]GLU61413.1 hypothetical protein Pure01_39260 [Paenarthrobacter ureafaciens]GLU65641.1 hypothetical protein Pure02_38910 [Paenarthrobacter ureafaciens]GLU69954.1 hypothetical protein Pure03_39300 [Paenarthrobacter ureafaciens]GLU74201.1 hypothetical protein Pure04_39160 [Paenarthrobacter ureafaciens]GLU78484.1 hypothetical protein Pure05_39240 [Paenarthrobacter ureafaciens]